jgi:hypothetical protein
VHKRKPDEYRNGATLWSWNGKQAFAKPLNGQPHEAKSGYVRHPRHVVKGNRRLSSERQGIRGDAQVQLYRRGDASNSLEQIEENSLTSGDDRVYAVAPQQFIKIVT